MNRNPVSADGRFKTPVVALGAVLALCIATADSASAQTDDRGLLAIAVEEAGVQSPLAVSTIAATEAALAKEPATAEDCCAGNANDDSVRWKPALFQSIGFTAVQHLFRLRETKTRNELGGPFLADWFESVGSLGGNWDDVGKTFTNYIAHPMGGAVYANIYRQNDPKSIDLEFGDERYGGMLLKAMLFSAVVSTQFELGPFSEASIGNVGQNDDRKMGWVDLLITPTLGVAWMAGEDAIDQFLLKRLDGTSVGLRSVVRLLLNPSRSGSNLARRKLPWYRSRDLGYGDDLKQRSAARPPQGVTN